MPREILRLPGKLVAIVGSRRWLSPELGPGGLATLLTPGRRIRWQHSDIETGSGSRIPRTVRS